MQSQPPPLPTKKEDVAAAKNVLERPALPPRTSAVKALVHLTRIAKRFSEAQGTGKGCRTVTTGMLRNALKHLGFAPGKKLKGELVETLATVLSLRGADAAARVERAKRRQHIAADGAQERGSRGKNIMKPAETDESYERHMGENSFRESRELDAVRAALRASALFRTRLKLAQRVRPNPTAYMRIPRSLQGVVASHVTQADLMAFAAKEYPLALADPVVRRRYAVHLALGGPVVEPSKTLSSLSSPLFACPRTSAVALRHSDWMCWRTR